MAVHKISSSKNGKERNSDEQVLYIDPAEDITTIRERLARVSDRRIVLIFPAQTQMRSRLAWRLLYKRAQELGKEIAIVSTDAQIRALARSVQFQHVEVQL